MHLSQLSISLHQWQVGTWSDSCKVQPALETSWCWSRCLSIAINHQHSSCSVEAVIIKCHYWPCMLCNSIVGSLMYNINTTLHRLSAPISFSRVQLIEVRRGISVLQCMRMRHGSSHRTRVFGRTWRLVFGLFTGIAPRLSMSRAFSHWRTARDRRCVFYGCQECGFYRCSRRLVGGGNHAPQILSWNANFSCSQTADRLTHWSRGELDWLAQTVYHVTDCLATTEMSRGISRFYDQSCKLLHQQTCDVM